MAEALAPRLGKPITEEKGTEMKMTHEQLVAYYEKQLAKVEESWGGKRDALGNEGEAYIEYARRQLEAVRNGREW